METSVIIPAKDAESYLAECLASVTAQSGFILGKDYEVIVIDDGSTDNTALISKNYPVTLIRQSNQGPASARNAGALQSQGDILAFTDADCVPKDDWLENIILPFKQAEIIGAKGVYQTQEKGLVPRFVQAEYEYKYERMKKQKFIDFIDTYSAAYRRKIYLENNGFDESFPVPSVEDQELSFRLARKGYKMVFLEKAVVIHRHDLYLMEYVRRKFNIGFWKAVLLQWHPEKSLSDSHTPSTQRWQIVLLGASIILSLILAVIAPNYLWIVTFTLLGFIISCMKFGLFVFRQDKSLTPILLPMLVTRAMSLGLGLIFGIFYPARRQQKLEGLNFVESFIKRSFDILGAAVGLVISLPFQLAAAAAIYLEDRRPIVYTQYRVGAHGNCFKLYKLRTMSTVESGNLPEPGNKDPNDPRVTRVGRILRRWSIDELPQFINVLKGDMSLVGPRPEEAWVVEGYDDEYRKCLVVRPGITGPMQVSGRGRLSVEERLELDLDYLKNYSIRKDILILLKTIPTILSGDGAF